MRAVMGALLLFITLFSMPSASQDAKQITKAFANNDSIESVQLAPNGKHLGVLQKINEKRQLIILDSETLKPVNTIHFADKDDIASFVWATDKRLVLKLALKKDRYDFNLGTGELYAVNFDGSDAVFIHGARAMARNKTIKQSIVKNLSGPVNAKPIIIDTLDGDPEHILVLLSKYDRHSDNVRRYIYKFNINKFQRHYVTTTGKTHLSSFVHFAKNTDNIWALSQTSKGQYIFELYDEKEDEWQTINLDTPTKQARFVSQVKPGFFYYTGYCGQSPLKKLCEFDMKEGKSRMIAEPRNSDMTFVTTSYEGHPLFASTIHLDERYIPVADDFYAANLTKQLLGVFKQSRVFVSSAKNQGTKFLVNEFSNTKPQAWYLFDQEKNNLQFVGQSQLALRGPFQSPYTFESPIKINGSNAKDDAAMMLPQYDGIFIPAKGVAQASKTAPTLLLATGSIVDREHDYFNEQASLFSELGYNVVKVNARGTEGKGLYYETNSNGQLVNHGVADYAAALKLLADNNLIDKNRVCGYSEGEKSLTLLMLAATHPDVLKCVVTYNGIYDVDYLMYRSARRSESYHAYMKAKWGESSEGYKAQSPTEHAKAIKAPLLLVYGMKSLGKLKQSEAMESALNKADVPFERERFHKSLWVNNPEEKAALNLRIHEFMQSHLAVTQ